MVKFAKQLEGQLVPEWRAAFVTYKLLKKDLKLIKQQHRTSTSSVNLASIPYHTLGETLAALGGHLSELTRSKSTTRSRRDLIKVNQKSGPDQEERYETELREPLADNEPEISFFARLDAQLNKVSKFYRAREQEFVQHAESLDKQMLALIEMRKVLNQQQLGDWLDEDDVAERSMSMTRDLEAGARTRNSRSKSFPINISEEETSELNDISGIYSSSKSIPELDDSFRSAISELGEIGITDFTEVNYESGIHGMRVKIPAMTPGVVLSSILAGRWTKQSDGRDGDEHVTKRKVNYAEKLLRAAFVEFYRGLSLLKSYSSLNTLAFAKILKKYDKVSGHRVCKVYLKAVETSYFSASDKVPQLMEKVENIFTDQFAGYNHRKAMRNLRPLKQKASHSVTFFLGLFSGCSLALVVAYFILLRILLPDYQVSSISDNLADGTGSAAYLRTIFPTFSMLALILLHMYMYGFNVYFWKLMRINYTFIFEFAPGTELRCRQIFMVCSTLLLILVGTTVGHLALHKTTNSPYIDLIPVLVFVIFILLLVCPVNICYRSSRVFFLNCLLHIVGSPLYKVVLADFFLADQFTSQVPMLRNMEFVLCYYCGGLFRTGNSHGCTDNKGYSALSYVFSVLPYWWRLMQCVRRFIDEADQAHVANGGKYLSAVIAVIVRIQYEKNNKQGWLVMTVFTSTFATAYQLYWDLVVDWGLLRSHSVNPWLRDHLIMPRKKYIYFISMILNALLRIAWMQSVTQFHFGGVSHDVNNFIFAALEVVRRGHWNFYRLENEHLNNVGKYRAIKNVPLPFEENRASED